MTDIAADLVIAEERYLAASRARRAAYQAWQQHPAGDGWTEALQAYVAANEAADAAFAAYDAEWKAYRKSREVTEKQQSLLFG